MLRHVERAREALEQLVEDAEALAVLRARLDEHRKDVGDERCSRPETDAEVLDRVLGPVVTEPLAHGVAAAESFDDTRRVEHCNVRSERVDLYTELFVEVNQLSFYETEGRFWVAARTDAEDVTLCLSVDGVHSEATVRAITDRGTGEHRWSRWVSSAVHHTVKLMAKGRGTVYQSALYATDVEPECAPGAMRTGDRDRVEHGQKWRVPGATDEWTGDAVAAADELAMGSATGVTRWAIREEVVNGLTLHPMDRESRPMADTNLPDTFIDAAVAIPAQNDPFVQAPPDIDPSLPVTYTHSVGGLSREVPTRRGLLSGTPGEHAAYAAGREAGLLYAAELAGDFDPFSDEWDAEQLRAGERALELFAAKLRREAE